MDEFLNSSIDSMTVSDKLIQQTGVIGEKLVIGSFEKISASYVGKYIHAGNKLGVMVELNCETDFVANTPDFQELVRDIAMHIAAAKPRFATRDEVTQEILDKEKEIAAHVAKESGKPDNIIEKIVTGKMEKFYEENCVLEQAFVKDTNVTIGELIKQKIALLGENINLGKFARFEI